MWPSFSLCAWRILKIRSCLRNPLAPGRSKDRAILVSSVIFFSFNSAMVIIRCHLRREFSKGGLLTQERLGQIAGRREGWFYAARRCASAKFSGSDRTVCRSELAILSRTSFMVSWILVLGL